MIDDEMLEMASLYVLGELTKDQTARFEAELLGSSELQETMAALQEDFASLALAAPVILPPAGLKTQLLQQFRSENQPTNIIRVSFIPWAIAAGLAVAAIFFFLQQNKLEKQVAELQSRDILAQTRVAVLQSQIQTYASGSAVVVWDQKNQKGLVRYDKLPKQEGKDYQLWALDPSQKEPINAGLIPVVNSEAAKVNFHPDIRVGKGTKFAVSIEQKGGSKQPAGQIIFVGE